jgi:hypothetical protein
MFHEKKIKYNFRALHVLCLMVNINTHLEPTASDALENQTSLKLLHTEFSVIITNNIQPVTLSILEKRYPHNIHFDLPTSKYVMCMLPC